jgi:hypothetical protein
MEFEDAFNFIEVMDDSKLLCIGFDDFANIYSIEQDPLCPKLIKNIDYEGNKMTRNLKLDENLIII